MREVFLPKWGQLDFDLGTVRLEVGITKAMQRRLVYLPSFVCGVLEGQWREHLERYSDCSYVFHHSGDQIRDLRLSGVEGSEEIRTPILAYLGDTAPQGLDQSPIMYEAQVLIAEMTFVAPGHSPDKIHKHGHMHVDDFVARRERFQNELVIASHFSTRYTDRQIQQFVKQALPDMLDGRLHLWI